MGSLGALRTRPDLPRIHLRGIAHAKHAWHGRSNSIGARGRGGGGGGVARGVSPRCPSSISGRRGRNSQHLLTFSISLVSHSFVPSEPCAKHRRTLSSSSTASRGTFGLNILAFYCARECFLFRTLGVLEEDRRVDGAEYRRYYHQHSTPDDSRSTAVAEYRREARGWCTVQTVLSLTPNK
jgi:hypothetical protein